jgi:hypothetical protein
LAHRYKTLMSILTLYYCRYATRISRMFCRFALACCGRTSISTENPGFVPSWSSSQNCNKLSSNSYFVENCLFYCRGSSKNVFNLFLLILSVFFYKKREKLSFHSLYMPNVYLQRFNYSRKSRAMMRRMNTFI